MTILGGLPFLAGDCQWRPSTALAYLAAQRREELTRRLDERIPQRAGRVQPDRTRETVRSADMAEDAESLRRQIEEVDRILVASRSRSRIARWNRRKSGPNAEARRRRRRLVDARRPQQAATAFGKREGPAPWETYAPASPDPPKPPSEAAPIDFYFDPFLPFKFKPIHLSWLFEWTSCMPRVIYVDATAPDENGDGTLASPLKSLDQVTTFTTASPLNPGDRLIFRAGTYSNQVNGKAKAVHIVLSKDANCKSQFPVVVEADADAIVDMYVCSPPGEPTKGTFYFGGADLGPTVVNLEIRNLNFIGRGNTPATERHRAHLLVRIEKVLTLTMRGCRVEKCRDIGEDAGYKALDKVLLGGYGLMLKGAQGGLIEDCVFDPMSNIDQYLQYKKDWRWPADTFMIEALLIDSCANLTVQQCVFGSAGHFGLQVQGSHAINIQRCYFRNRIHSAMEISYGSTHCIVQGNLFAGVGAWVDLKKDDPKSQGIATSSVMQITGRKHIVAFNIIHDDVDAKKNGYLLDGGIVLRGVTQPLCPPGTIGRCMSKVCYDLFKELAPTAEITKLCKDALLGPAGNLTCKNGQPAAPTGCGAQGGISLATGCCYGGDPPLVCPDMGVPDCTDKGMARVCIDASANNTVAILKQDVSVLPAYMNPFGQIDEADGTAVLYNLVLNTSQTALDLSQSHGVVRCFPEVRNSLIAGNIIFGQRTDPTVDFVVGFDPKNSGGVPPFSKLPIAVSEATPLVAIKETSHAMVNIRVPGTYEKTNGNWFLDNIVGRGPADSVGMTTEQWSGPAPGKGPLLGAVGVMKVSMSEQFIEYTKGELNKELNFGFPAVPDWVIVPASKGDPMSIVAQNPFATDWTLKLPQAFKQTTLAYRWASVRELNGILGTSNTTAVGLKIADTEVQFFQPGSKLESMKYVVKVPQKGGITDPLSGPWLPPSKFLPPATLDGSGCGNMAGALKNPEFAHVAAFLAGATDFAGNPFVAGKCSRGPFAASVP